MTTRQLRRVVIAGVLVIQTIMLVSVMFLLQRSWEVFQEQARLDVQRTVSATESAVNRAFIQADSMLAGLPDFLADDQAGAAREIGQERVSARLRTLGFQMFSFRDVLLLRSDGTVWASARQGSRRTGALSELVALAGQARPGASVIVGPLRRTSGSEWTVHVVRSIALPGQGAMIAAAEIPIAALTGAVGTTGEELGIRIAILREGGVLLASVPHDESRIGRPSPQIDADPFSVAASRATLYPGIIVTARLDGASLMAKWAVPRDRLLIVAAACTLLFFAFGAIFLRGLRHQEKLERDRMEAQRRLEEAIEAMSDGFVMWDRDDRFVTCNRRYLELYRESAPYIRPGVSFAEIMRQGALSGQYPQMEGDVEAFVERMVRWHQSNQGSFERLLPDGTWLLVTERRTSSDDIVGIRTDITQLKRAQENLAQANDRVQSMLAELRQQNMLFDAALQNMSHGLLMIDAGRRVIVANLRLCALFGVPEAPPGAGETFEGLLGRARADLAPMIEDMVRRQLAMAADGRSGAFVALGPNDRAIEISQRPMADGGFVATYEDVTEQHRIERRVRHLAHHDPLTNLPNRNLFRQSMEEAALNRQGTKADLAIVYFDLDRFKDVNDTLGHPTGDRLLKQVAERVLKLLEPGEIVARLGGDEFAVLVTGPEASARAHVLGESLIARLSQSFEIAGQMVGIGVSVGIALADDPAVEPDELLKQADVALYAAKSSGRGRACRFLPEMGARLERRITLETALRTALAQQEFDLDYQPIRDTRTRRIISFEALIRWRHPVLGNVSPGEFIPIAEDNGQIDEIGAWAVAKACHDAAALPPDTRMAVNLSPVQLKNERLAGIVEQALARSGLPPHRLELEVTETAILSSDERILSQLFRLQALGVRISLDDFGVGFSSLNHLRRFPFNKVKIDQVFVREAVERADCRAIIKAIIQLADSMNIRTTAEGIETEEQLELMRTLGAAEVQGYYLGRPASLLRAMSALAEQDDRMGDAHGLRLVARGGQAQA